MGGGRLEKKVLHPQRFEVSTLIFVNSYFIIIASLILLNALGGYGVGDGTFMLFIRGLLHLIPCMVLLFLWVLNCRNSITVEKYTTARSILFLLMLVFIFLSLFMNGLEYDNVARAVITILHIFNFTIILPISMSFINVRRALNKLTAYYVWLMFVVCLLVICQYYYGGFVWSRLGFPFIPGVYAYMCLIALIVSFKMLNSTALSFFFIANIFMSGSRSALALALLVYLISNLSKFSLKRIFILILGVTLVAIWFLMMTDFARPFLVERDDLFSGRLEIWSEALAVIGESPAWGLSHPMLFATEAVEGGLAAHNSFLSLSVQYGIFYALLAYGYWLHFIKEFYKCGIRISDCAWLVFLIISIKSFVTNIFWTNMGDGSSYFAFILMTMFVFLHRATNIAYERKT